MRDRPAYPPLGAGVLLALALAFPGEAALKVHPDNPRWLTEDGGKTAIVFTGAHTWSLFQDLDGGPEFDAAAYLDGLAAQGHNFTRGWFWEDSFYSPLPYAIERRQYRLSPPYERAYLNRLRSRVRAARKRGLYVSAMFFQGWSMASNGGLRRPDPWPENPYHRDNHRERVTKESAALHIGHAQEQQLEYVTWVAGRLCSEPNVLFEVSNESHGHSLGNPRVGSWQGEILAAIKSACRRRLTWISCPANGDLPDEFVTGHNARLYATEADLISPCDPDDRFVDNPPAADGRKVVLADSDHFVFEQIDGSWAWRSFLRGQHPIFMDLTQELGWWFGAPWETDDPSWAETRAALGSIQELVTVVNRDRGVAAASGLGEMAPQKSRGGSPGARTRPASSPWALYSSDEACPRKRAGAKCQKARANGDEILAWADGGETLRLCRLVGGEVYRARWKRPFRRGFEGPAESLAADGDGCLDLVNPAQGPLVAHLERTVP